MSPSAPSQAPQQIQSVTPGIYTPIVTFYKSDGKTIDYDTQIKHARYLKENGIAGLVALGSTGEFSLLSKYERIELISNLRNALPDYPIIGGIGENNLGDAIDSIKAYKEAGATFAMILPSSYYGAGTSQEGIYDWLKEVADSSELPLLLYLFPGVCNGLQVSPEIVKKLSSHKNIIGCKCTHNDVHQYSRIGLDEEIAANNFALLSGFGQLLIPVHAINGKGVIDALSGVFPKLFVELFKSLEAGDFKTAKRLQYIASEGEVMAGKSGFLGIKRAIREHLGMGESIAGRKPMNYPVTDQDWEKNYKPYYDLIKKVEDTL